MRTTLEDLFYGRISPNDKPFAVECDAKGYQNVILEAEEALEQSVNEEQLVLLKRMFDTFWELLEATELDRFIEGFRLGTRLMLEAMDGNDGDLIDIV